MDATKDVLIPTSVCENGLHYVEIDIVGHCRLGPFPTEEDAQKFAASERDKIRSRRSYR